MPASHRRLFTWFASIVGLLIVFDVSAEPPIDVNRATAAQLTQLPGVGPRRAEAMIQARRRRPFRRLRDLLRIRGIGPKMLKRLAPKIYIAPPVPRRRRLIRPNTPPPPVTRATLRTPRKNICTLRTGGQIIGPP